LKFERGSAEDDRTFVTIDGIQPVGHAGIPSGDDDANPPVFVHRDLALVQRALAMGEVQRAGRTCSSIAW
jgi:hypothetical protein